MEFIAAKCPSCGGDIQLPKSVVSAKCMYCGSDVNVQKAVRDSGTSINLDNIRELASDALEGSNYTEAYRHANTLLEHNTKDAEALVIKAEAAGMQSTLASHRLSELVQCVQKAVQVTPDDEALHDRAFIVMMTVGDAFHSLARGHLMEFSNPDTWSDYIGWLLETKAMYTIALDMNPSRAIQIMLLHRTVELYKCLLEGYSGSVYTGSGEMPVKLSIPDTLKPEIKSTYDDYVKQLQELEPDYQPQAIVEKGGCFIATAATGSASSQMTLGLRIFRNEVLDKSHSGKRIIQSYYKHSPAFVPLLLESHSLRSFVKWVVVFPAFVVSILIMKVKG